MAQLLCRTVMKNITLKIDDETYRKARVLAAERETSVSAMVREFLEQQTRESPAERERIANLEQLFKEADERARRKPVGQQPITPLTRDEIYAERLR
jgi:predicted transcriptional regulator